MDHGDFTNKVDALFMLNSMSKTKRDILNSSTNKKVRDIMLYTSLREYQDRKNGKDS